jgi:hypothetical protein
MYEVPKPSNANDYMGERPDASDNYYVLREPSKGVYSLDMIDGLATFPDEPVYRARLLTRMEIQKPKIDYSLLRYIPGNESELPSGDSDTAIGVYIRTKDEKPQPGKTYYGMRYIGERYQILTEEELNNDWLLKRPTYVENYTYSYKLTKDRKPLAGKTYYIQKGTNYEELIELPKTFTNGYYYERRT